MDVRFFQIDAFCDEVFSGNPAGVCPLDQWLDDELMQKIAAENNLSETAFFVRNGEYFDLRWFTPEMEIDLCGHATLASAHVLFEYLGYEDQCVIFETKSGRLFVDREGDLLSMDLPSWLLKPFNVTKRISDALADNPKELYATRDLLAVFDSEEHVRALEPDLVRMAELEYICIIATAPAKDHDFICRVFAPCCGVPEDPVTGSAFCTLVPYWAKRLGKKKMVAFQASARGGEVVCEEMGDRIRLSGKAVCYLTGTIHI